MTLTNGNFMPCMQYEIKSIQKVQDWLVSLQGCAISVDDEDVEDGEINLRSGRTVRDLPTTSRQKVNKNISPPNENDSYFCLRKWTIRRFSLDCVILKGQLTTNTGKIVNQDYLAGSVMSRPKPNQVVTSKGLFTLVGGVQDPNNEIPIAVRKQFANAFPSAWKSIIAKHWSLEYSLDGSSCLDDSECIVNDERLKDTGKVDTDILNKGEVPITTVGYSKDESSFMVPEIRDNKKKRRTIVTSKKKEQHKRERKNKCNDSSTEQFLQNWTLTSDSQRGFILIGYLYSPSSKKTSSEVFTAGPVLSRVESNKVKTEKGTFTLMGQFYDPEGAIPENVKTKFANCFPVRWRKILNDSWNTINESHLENSLSERKGKRKCDVPDVKLPEKRRKCGDQPPTIKSTKRGKSAVKPKKKSIKNKNCKTKNNNNLDGPVEAGKIPPKKTNSRRGNAKQTKKDTFDDDSLNMSVEEEDSCLDCSSMEYNSKNIKKGQTTVKSKQKNQKKKAAREHNDSLDESIEDIEDKKTLKKKNLKRKTKTKEKHTEEIVEQKATLEAENPFNFTRNSLFSTSQGFVFNSFQELSLGECLKSAKKSAAQQQGKETPPAKYCAWDAFKNSMVSTQSAPSSPEAHNHKQEFGKRVQRLYKVKKKLNKSGKRKAVNTRNYGNKEVNAVLKQITKSSNKGCTPKIIKKVFRSRTPRDSDDSFPLNSSEEFHFSDNDFL